MRALRDRLPTVIGFAMAMGLWTVILSGAGILLNSVVEDKSSRVLEVLLASASTSEIMGGKILGVAAVTFSVLGIWLTLGTAMLLTSAPGLSEDLVAILATKGLAYYFGFYLVGDGSDRAYRARCRPPSVLHFALFPQLIRGHTLSDVVAVLGSLNIIAAELDR